MPVPRSAVSAHAAAGGGNRGGLTRAHAPPPSVSASPTIIPSPLPPFPPSSLPSGLGNMAVSNAFGSNSFNILIGLGLPWFVFVWANGWETYKQLPAEGIVVPVVLLVGEWGSNGRNVRSLTPTPPLDASDTVGISPPARGEQLCPVPRACVCVRGGVCAVPRLCAGVLRVKRGR